MALLQSLTRKREALRGGARSKKEGGKPVSSSSWSATVTAAVTGAFHTCDSVNQSG